MKREQIKAILPILTAFAEGKEVQKKNQMGEWVTLVDPLFHAPAEFYRIKPDIFTVYMNIYKQATGGCVLEKDDLISPRDRQGYLTVTWENGQFKDVTFTKV